jgi:phosphate transport system permease protein
MPQIAGNHKFTIMEKKSRLVNDSDRPKGEIFVWVTGTGLMIGLMMIVALLGIIVSKGIGVFWPHKVVLVTLKEDAEPKFRNQTRVAGIVTMEMDIDLRSLTEQQISSKNPLDRREKQLFTGNRDAYGASFAFFNVGMIASMEYPADIMVVERMEWGDGIFVPLRLEGADGTVLQASEPGFDRALRKRVGEVQDRRAKINRIERGEIGPISAGIREIDLRRDFLNRKKALGDEEKQEIERLVLKREQLNEKFLPLRDQASELRRLQLQEWRLHYQLVSGEQRSMPLGDLVSYHHPNRMNLFQKTGHWFVEVYHFLTRFPREANTEGGIWPAIFGTFVMTMLMSIAVTPFGVLAAIYLREYAKQGPFVRAVRIAINNLAGVPSIVFGIFGLGFFIYFVGDGIDTFFFPEQQAMNTPVFGSGGILWASLTLALMTVPVVIVATEEAIAAVSRGVREGSLACGASKWQTIQNLVLPASAPGILTGLILAMARGAGEVAPLMLVGVVALAPNLPIDGVFPFIHLERQFMHLGFFIYDLGFQSPDSEAAKPMVFATTMVLISLVVMLNVAAIGIRNHLRKKYQTSAF